MEDVPGRLNSSSLTRERKKRLWYFAAFGSPNSAEYDMERQRSNHTASLAADNATARQHRPVRCSALPFQGRAVRDLPKVGLRRQPHVHPGLDNRKEVRYRIAVLNLIQRRSRPVQRKLNARESNGLRVLVS